LKNEESLALQCAKHFSISKEFLRIEPVVFVNRVIVLNTFQYQRNSYAILSVTWRKLSQRAKHFSISKEFLLVEQNPLILF